MNLGEKPLPANLEAEKFVLGSLLLESTLIEQALTLTPEDFATERHRQIFDAMRRIHEAGDAIDRVAIHAELTKAGQHGGALGYMADLTEGVPEGVGIDSHVRSLQEKALLRRAILTAQHLMNRCFQAGESAGNILLDCQRAIDALSGATRKTGEWVTPTEVVRNYPGGVHQFVSRKQGGVGITMPWPPLTEMLGGGMHAGELFLVAGRPSMGKSLAGMQMAHQAAKGGHGSAVFSLEMSKESLTERLLCGIARVDHQKFRAGYLNATEKAKLTEIAADLEELPLWIDDSRARAIPAMIQALRRLCARHPVEVVMVDHLQLMTSGGNRKGQDRRNQELSEILHDFKHEATKMNATFVVLSQLNRQCEIENRQPQLSDLKDTGTAEEDADVVMFVHRPERYAKNHSREDLRGHAEFIIAKQRNGPVGLKNMVFIANWQRFECCVEDMSHDDYTANG